MENPKMRYFFLLTLLFTSTVFAVDATLVRQSLGKCYYDDGSVLNRATCPNRLSVGNNSNSRPNLGMSEESVQWRLNFGKQQADGLSSIYTPSVPSVPSAQQIAAQKQQSANEVKMRKDFADYVSKNHGVEGEGLRALIMSGVIDSTNYEVFVD
tara:strand:- start:34 stop:495 length:462 start_codon:yes stop_codon:yes gene_type:complete